jgi:hypothetical protein
VGLLEKGEDMQIFEEGLRHHVISCDIEARGKRSLSTFNLICVTVESAPADKGQGAPITIHPAKLY